MSYHAVQAISPMTLFTRLLFIVLLIDAGERQIKLSFMTNLAEQGIISKMFENYYAFVLYSFASFAR